jgi:hypothetical protein
MSSARFMIMHRTNAHWESGATPSPELIARVGELVGDLVKANALLGAEGLRASSQGVRLQFTNGQRTVIDGPFAESKELIAGFAILRAASLQEAVQWATKFGQVFDTDVEIDIRPVTEPWDIGIGEKPAGLTTRRYMAAHKHRGSDGCRPLTPKQRAAMGALIDEMKRTGVMLSAEGLEGSPKGARITSHDGQPVVMDGPFTESKELLGGFVIVRAETLREAVDWGLRYFKDVGAEEVDVRPIAEPPKS